jgi:hypothetical protein
VAERRREKRQVRPGESSSVPERPISVFLTAYDPSDLPGLSIDPLGFERGYLFLAGKILPGLTNVASNPRYFGVLCAGCYLAPVDGGQSDREVVATRRESVLRLERLWALASALAARARGDSTAPGLRGITYVNAELDRLAAAEQGYAYRDFKLLSRQAAYGVLGIYGPTGEGMRLWDRSTFTLAPDSGEVLAEAFLEESAAPTSVRASVTDRSAQVKLDVLEKWGETAGATSPPGPRESAVIREMLLTDPVRAQMCHLLERDEWSGESAELSHLQRIADRCTSAHQDPEMQDAIRTILAYELCYQVALLAFQRLLWMCSEAPSGKTSRAERESDLVLRECTERLPRCYAQLRSSFDHHQTSHVGLAPDTLDDVMAFLSRAAGSRGPEELAEACVARHREIQSGKFDQGRPKMAWLEDVAGELSLAPTRVTLPDFEPQRMEHIRPHTYRVGAATNLIAAAGGLA